MLPSLTINALAQWIVDFFQAGITLAAEHHAYIQSTFATTDPAAIMDACDGSEIESFLQLIYYPDQTLRLRFETEWGETLFSPTDIEAVMMRLNRTPLWGRIIPGLGLRELSVELTTDLLQTWIERLKILWQPAPVITRHLSRVEEKYQRVVIRTHLRHAPIEWHKGQTALMVRFLNQTHPSAEADITCLSDLLSLLTQMSPDQAVDSFFADRKAFFFESLCKAEAFEARRRDQAMEVLMLQGCRAAFGNVAHWRREMAKIDRLSRFLFGNIPDIAPMDCRTQELPQKAIYKPFQLL